MLSTSDIRPQASQRTQRCERSGPQTLVNPADGTTSLLQIDSWVLFDNYVLPSKLEEATILTENGSTHTTARAFALDAQNAADAVGVAPKWLVRTTAIYEQILAESK